jgi:hypothetical protein
MSPFTASTKTARHDMERYYFLVAGLVNLEDGFGTF